MKKFTEQQVRNKFYQEAMQEGGEVMLENHNFEAAAGIAAASARVEVRVAQGKSVYLSDFSPPIDTATGKVEPICLL